MNANLNSVNVPTATLSMDAFIIPNNASLLSELMAPDTPWYQSICAINNKEFNLETTKMVQMWMVSEDCDNLQCHYPYIMCGDTCYNYLLISLFPATLFEGYKEGDVIEMRIPVTGFDGDGEPHDFVIDAKVQLAQKRYRYRNYGPFEHVLNMVMG